MRSTCLISIIINNYNYARYVGQAIESALAQTYPRTEVVVVDDGSTDDSLDIIRRYDGRVKVLAKPNGGQASAFNAGLPLSSGEIVLFLDSDDMLDPGAASALATAWREGVAKAQFPLFVIDEFDNFLGYTVPSSPFHPGKEMALLRALGEYPCPPCTGNAYDRASLERVFPVPEDCCPDGYLTSLAPFFGEILCINTPLGRYRLHGRNDHAQTDLRAIRRMLLTAMRKEAAIKEWASATGAPLDRSLVTRVPGHCKARLVSFRLDRANHPFRKDTVASLVRAGIVAAWGFPHINWSKRYLVMALFPIVGLIPKRILRAQLSRLFPLEARRAFKIRPAAPGRWAAS